MNVKEKIALVIVGIEVVSILGGAVYCYGKSQFYKGRLSMAKEMQQASEEVLEAFNEHISEISKDYFKTEEAKLS